MIVADMEPWTLATTSNIKRATTTKARICHSSSKAEAAILTPAVPQIEGEEKDSNFGKEAVIKTFYEGPRGSCRCCINWVECKPEELTKAVVKSHNEAAIRLYKVKDHSASGHGVFDHLHALKFHSVEIQSPFIVAAIKQVLEDSGMLHTDNQTAKFSEPFRELYFCYDKIVGLQQQYRSTVEDITKTHLELFTTLMNELFGNTVAEVNDLLKKKLICFERSFLKALRYTQTSTVRIGFIGLLESSWSIMVAGTSGWSSASTFNLMELTLDFPQPVFLSRNSLAIGGYQASRCIPWDFMEILIWKRLAHGVSWNLLIPLC